MSDLERDALRALLVAAPSRPWTASHARHMQHDICSAEPDAASLENETFAHCDYASAASLIVAAVNALPRLLDRVEQLEADVATLRSALRSLGFGLRSQETAIAETLEHLDAVEAKRKLLATGESA